MGEAGTPPPPDGVGEPSGSVGAAAGGGRLAPDPAAYDSERNEHARRRGLDAPYIAGGRDPDPDRGRREERRYLRWLLIMVVAIVLSGFVLGFVGTFFIR